MSDPFRDDREGLRHRVEKLEGELADARAELEAERKKSQPKPEEPKSDEPKTDDNRSNPRNIFILGGVAIAALGLALTFGLNSETKKQAESTASAVMAPAPPPATIPYECREGTATITNAKQTVGNDKTGYLVNASGTCHVILVNPDLHALRLFDISGDAVVEVRGGKVEGSAELLYSITKTGSLQLKDHAIAIGAERHDHALDPYTTIVHVDETSMWSWPRGITQRWIAAADCLSTTDLTVREARAAYKGPSADIRLSGLETKSCVDLLGPSSSLQPPIPDFDAALVAYGTAIDRLAKIHKKASAYYANGDYRDDNLALGKTMHPELAGAFDDAIASGTALRAAAAAQRSAVETELATATPIQNAAWKLLLAFSDVGALFFADAKPKTAELVAVLDAYIAADIAFENILDGLPKKPTGTFPEAFGYFEKMREGALALVKQARRRVVDSGTRDLDRHSYRLSWGGMLSDLNYTFAR